MALVYKKGDILEATENIICHQVNVEGVMGGGLAKQIASRYPNVEEEYKKFCDIGEHNYDILSGLNTCVYIGNYQYIANCFTQKPNFDTDYDSIKYCFKDLLFKCKRGNDSIAVPYKYGCGIANGNWNIVSKTLENLSNQYKVDITIYKLESEEDI